MLCVYAVTRVSHPGVNALGVQSAPVRIVREGDLAAIVGEVAGDLLARRRDVDAHMSVLEQALSAGDVLPFRFGTVVADEPAIRGALSDSARAYGELLDRLSGLVQMTVKAVYDETESVRAAVDADPHLRRDVSLRRNSTTITDRVALGERVAAAVDRLNRVDSARITDRLTPFARAVASDAVVAPTVVSLALLMDPHDLTRLDAAIAELHDEFGHRMTFDYAGPMPAYSFVA